VIALAERSGYLREATSLYVFRTLIGPASLYNVACWPRGWLGLLRAQPDRTGSLVLML
jgi:hypothetical protein